MAPSVRPSKEELTRLVSIYRKLGWNVNATTRELGIPRSTVRHRLRYAAEEGLLQEDRLYEACASTRDRYFDARTRMVANFQEKQRKGQWDKPILVRIPEGPFRLKVFGDPHMDSAGFDIELWEKHWFDLNPANRVFGVCVGDWFNNWPRVLAHLWKDETARPSDAWTCFEHYMDVGGPGLVAACSGNHDDWTHGPVNPVDLMMKKNGVVYRMGAARVFLAAGESKPIRIALRHKWKGHSQYSPAHALRVAASRGWEDHILVGGHIHQDDSRIYVNPRTGFISHLCQVSAFKKYDDYADVHGLFSHSIQPVWDLVVQPDRLDSDPEKVKVWWDPDEAQRHLESLL